MHGPQLRGARRVVLRQSDIDKAVAAGPCLAEAIDSASKSARRLHHIGRSLITIPMKGTTDISLCAELELESILGLG
jgi:hypothetical protein